MELRSSLNAEGELIKLNLELKSLEDWRSLKLQDLDGARVELQLAQKAVDNAFEDAMHAAREIRRVHDQIKSFGGNVT